ncbi:MAG: ATP-dependent DNA helicase DinG [Rhodocyclaceae bacterium]|nr:ATP-dependent DNA helicase DinG [Rhodocyclaceae bacterium]
MLEDQTKEHIRQSLKAVASRLPGFRARDGQRLMIAEVAKVFARHPDPAPEGKEPPARPETGTTILCAQGGTGVGKSLAYSLPGALLAKQKQKKLLIATATVALQEQLTGKDLPLFFKAAGLDLSVELAKGRTRYVCRFRLQQALRDMQQATMFGQEDRPQRAEERDEAVLRTVEALAKDYDDGRWDGDRDLRHGLDETLWRAITTDRHGCLGTNCPSLKQCAQVMAKKRLKEADVIVANHDLLLADLAMGGGKVLPPPSECFYVIDEAHHLPAKAVSSFASSHLLGRGRQLMERLASFAPGLAQAIGHSYIEDAKAVVETAKRVEESLAEAYGFFDSLAQLKPNGKTQQPKMDFQDSAIPEGFIDIGKNILSGTDAMMARLRKAVELLGAALPEETARKALFEKLVADAGFHIGRIEEIADTWALFLEMPDDEHPPIAKWVETVADPKTRGADFRVCASPVSSAAQLRHLLWEKAAGAVLTSATMTTLGNFKNFLARSGLSVYSKVTCIEVPSPFNYYEQGTLEIPPMKALPDNYAGHTAEVSDWLQAGIRALGGEGMLVLFTSRKQMSDVASRLPEDLRGKVLVQGDGSKAEIISRHKACVDRGEASVIFGLESFSEGVDLAHRYCTRVVVTKLPFDVPDDPVLKALAGWIERRGGKPFLKVWVPTAARKLEQRAGRLIRSETDSGTVTVLDKRLWIKEYGRMILRGMPPFRLVVDGKERRL